MFRDLYLDESYELDEKIFNKIYDSHMSFDIKRDDNISEMRSLLVSLCFGDTEITEILQNYIKNGKGMTLFNYILNSNAVYLSKYKILLLHYYLKREQRNRKQKELIAASVHDKTLFQWFLAQGITTNECLIDSFKRGVFSERIEHFDEINQLVKFLSYDCYGDDLNIKVEYFEMYASSDILGILGFNSKQIEKIIDHVSNYSDYSVLALLEYLSQLYIEYGISRFAITLLNYYHNKCSLRRIK